MPYCGADKQEQEGQVTLKRFKGSDKNKDKEFNHECKYLYKNHKKTFNLNSFLSK